MLTYLLMETRIIAVLTFKVRISCRGECNPFYAACGTVRICGTVPDCTLNMIEYLNVARTIIILFTLLCFKDSFACNA